MNKNHDIDTIISAEEFKRNRKRHLERDAKKLKEQKKERIRNIIGVVMFYLVLIAGVLLIDARFKYLDQQKNADVVATQTAPNK